MKLINESTIIICSIVRNAEKGLKNNIPVIKKLCQYFKDYKIDGDKIKLTNKGLDLANLVWEEFI